MATNKDPVFRNEPRYNLTSGSSYNSGVTYTDADTTTAKVIYTAGSNGAFVDKINAHNTEATPYTAQLFLNDGANDYAIGEVVIPASAGSDGGTTSSKNLLDNTDLALLDSDNALVLPAGQVLKVAMKSTITASETITLLPIGWEL